MKRLVVAVTGTPGTGKTTFSRALAERIGAHLVDLNDFITSLGIYRLDKEGTKVADLRKMRSEFGKLLKKTEGNLVVDGLLSHFLSPRQVTHVVVLRTNPRVLRKRLERRGFSGKKLNDNLESEALDIVLWEAVKLHGISKVYEIDTTGRPVRDCVEDFLAALEGKCDLRPGRVDWLEEYFFSGASTSKPRHLARKHVVTCFLENRGRILLLKRSEKVGTYRGKWGAVAGYVEEGETPREAAEKEILEETGIRDFEMVAEGRPHEFRDESIGVVWVIHPFRFRVKTRKVKIDWEHVEARWVRPEEIRRMDTVPHLWESWLAVLTGDDQRASSRE